MNTDIKSYTFKNLIFILKIIFVCSLFYFLETIVINYLSDQNFIKPKISESPAIPLHLLTKEAWTVRFFHSRVKNFHLRDSKTYGFYVFFEEKYNVEDFFRK